MRKKAYIEVMHENKVVEVLRKDNRCVYDDDFFLYYYFKPQQTINYRKYNRFRRGLP